MQLLRMKHHLTATPLALVVMGAIGTPSHAATADFSLLAAVTNGTSGNSISEQVDLVVASNEFDTVVNTAEFHVDLVGNVSGGPSAVLETVGTFAVQGDNYYPASTGYVEYDYLPSGTYDCYCIVSGANLNGSFSASTGGNLKTF